MKKKAACDSQFEILYSQKQDSKLVCRIKDFDGVLVFMSGCMCCTVYIFHICEVAMDCMNYNEIPLAGVADCPCIHPSKVNRGAEDQ